MGNFSLIFFFVIFSFLFFLFCLFVCLFLLCFVHVYNVLWLVISLCLFVYFTTTHVTKKRQNKSTKDIYYRESGEEALGKTIGLTE